MTYTVKKLADLAGVSPRTLRYYDRIGLLTPDAVGANGYRYYGEKSVLRLQQILFYRELDLPLVEIKTLMGQRGFSAQRALRGHREALLGRVTRLQRLIRTVDDTILYLQGEKPMTKKQLFEPFSEETQEAYAKRAEEMYDPETVRASNRKWKAYSQAERKRIMDEGNAVYADLIAAIPEGPAGPAVQACIARWHKHLQYFWAPNRDQLLGLAALYNDSPEFRANFNALDPRLAPFMREAVAVYVERMG
ncbi:MAG: MerR family transcriptional regulator [Candidatus Aminicenantes bacterium]|nr:MerR family transcriptional regulator [Candidatus Aminicenantes bacterium]